MAIPRGRLRDPVRLCVVTPDQPRQVRVVGMFLSKRDAMPMFEQLVASNESIRVTIEPLISRRSLENSACFPEFASEEDF
jgi:hypothetical protein